jgi:thiamine-monophosphate kinase
MKPERLPGHNSMAEFELIKHLQDIISIPGGQPRADCVIGIGDDAAVLQIPPDRQLLVCTDTVAEGVHFPAGTDPRAIAHKALAVNLSDLAAMGARPAWFFMALTLPEASPIWLESFALGMADLAHESSILLAGGDVSSGALSITITALGLTKAGQALTRSGAEEGDLIVVSGQLGAAAYALKILQSGGEPDAGDLRKLEYPEPRLRLGRALRGMATACIDISDGLLSDLGHIIDQSGKDIELGAELDLGKIPTPLTLAALPAAERWTLQLSGGDDYELCFTVRPSSLQRLESVSRDCGVALGVIGTVTGVEGIVLREPGGGVYKATQTGYEHFQSAGAVDH